MFVLLYIVKAKQRARWACSEEAWQAFDTRSVVG
jgi:hypothetical protein